MMNDRYDKRSGPELIYEKLTSALTYGEPQVPDMGHFYAQRADFWERCLYIFCKY